MMLARQHDVGEEKNGKVRSQKSVGTAWPLGPKAAGRMFMRDDG